MSMFVNYHKRGVGLPGGCKDLGEVLEKKLARRRRAVSSPSMPTIRRHGDLVVPLSGIEEYVSMAYEPCAHVFILHLTLPDEQLSIDIHRLHGEIHAAVSVRFGTWAEPKVRDFFAQRRQPVQEPAQIPENFLPDQPWQTVHEISPPPTSAPAFSQLVSDLMCVTLGFTALTALRVNFAEMALEV